ncbi:hypothetical protein N7E70_008865 [Aminobacter sp. NyZ550]|uniref:hypothetical protein n=1 Tax=Aminobacter sp. NyZ550 TaxID=2979870 RepID=UPI0021D5C7DC|nr:hypothetical protein [Aminobacter sp. NyZ550]WAX96935.1 hypothetical protein N7E70_008865 [Aminobacter sp. NyZ550]
MIAQLQVTGSNEQRTAIQSLISSVTIGGDRITIDLTMTALQAQQRQMTEVEVRFASTSTIRLLSNDNLRTSSRHQEMPGQLPATRPIKAIARGATWYADLLTGRAKSAREIADQENLNERYVPSFCALPSLIQRSSPRSLMATMPSISPRPI